MTSLSRPTSSALATARDPGTSFANASAFSKWRVVTVSGNPAFARLRAMTCPIASPAR